MAGLRGLLARTVSPLQTIPASCRRALAWDSTSGLVGGLFNGALFPFLAVIARGELHASIYLIALLNCSGSVGNLLNPVVAHAARRRAKLPYVVWPTAIGRSIFFLMPLATAAPAFVAIAFLANFTIAFAAPAYAAVIRDAYPAARRGRCMGLVRVLVVIGTMGGSMVGGLLLSHHSYRFVFPAVTVLGLLSILAFSRVGVPAAPEEGASPHLRLADFFAVVRRDKSFRLYCTCFYLYGFGNLISGPVMTVVQVDYLHITPQWVGYLTTAGAASSVLGYLYWGRVVDRRGPFRLMLMVISVVVISPITYFFAQSVPVLLIASCATGFGWAGGDLGYINAAMRFGRRETATAYAAMFAFLQAMRGIPGPFLGAALKDLIGPRPVFLIALGFWIASAVVLLRSGALRINTEVE
jgi:MFS family permease